ncbi:hypothetical protein VNO77_23318 [Canavalia gladiata]|uniref:Uncharacterized protein n=1 Tax=Canavalia gladiata TaxID=3824 RepID=A0AAN9L9G2_CANGL
MAVHKPSRVRWLNFLDYVSGTGVKVNFEHVEGKMNVLADSLSRLVTCLCMQEQCPEKLGNALLLTEEALQIQKDLAGEAMEEEVNGMREALALNIQQFLNSVRYEKMKETSNKGHIMKYGQIQLPVLSQEDPSAFRPLPDLPVDLQQKTLLNALWKASTKRTKHQAGPRKGLYCKYSTLSATVGESRNCHWKGFYSFTEAYEYLLDFCRDTEQIYIEEEDHQGLTQGLQEQIAELTDLIADERAELSRLRVKRSQQESRLTIQAVPYDEFYRKMTLMSSFRNNFMMGLLKQEGTRCYNLIHSLAQEQHYIHLRELQMKIFGVYQVIASGSLLLEKAYHEVVSK